ncbi:ImmA/IrrE family metallo-endopeptidase [Flavobacterium acetivorans]|uniref:ImmA/IrrE family metallo-endopeptidase n=1 Tax=Flavobacterium acetivorans TaxID=2893883 RepID=UPI001E4AF303|nr:ImmA/IrrE family metallo-endopeptidase [Flavobacterium sp. F-29]UFH34545.1 ImmA/IrrE family metallo-endopeptidase [Flavobacterium sp. F-29]
MTKTPRLSKSANAAKDLLESCGLDNLIDFSLELFASGLGITLIEKPLENCDGRIIFGKTKTLVELNSEIEFEEKKRFTLAHEIGHFILHKNIEIHNDNEGTTSWFSNKESQAKAGKQESEANQFASELLMPTTLFIEKIKGKPFSPDLLRSLSQYFKTSITSVIFRYFELGNHPICIFYMHSNIVKYWKRPDDFPYFIIDRTRLAPPEDSVAAEFFDKGKIYPGSLSKRPIWKSTWFDVKDWENENQYKFFEYCIINKKYNTALSVVWEE